MADICQASRGERFFVTSRYDLLNDYHLLIRLV